MVEKLLITAAASWYIAYAVTSTSGPFGVFERLRELKGGRWHGRHGIDRTPKTNLLGQEMTGQFNETVSRNGLLDCIICLIFWIALLIGFLEGLTIIESIAAAGVALWLHGYTSWRYSQGSG